MKRTRFKKTVFENGLTLVTECLPEFQSLALGVWVKIGTRHEGPSIAGASHFLEHMLFKGTKKRTALEIAREIDQVGGDFNAFTTRDHTCFHLLLLNRDCDLGLEILGDVLMNSNFKTEEFERERQVILQEISMVEESPEEIAHDFYFEKIYGGHGLGRPILGTQKSIQKMRRADVVQFFLNHYRPDQLVFSVAGAISHEDVKRKLKPLAQMKWPGRTGKEPKVETEWMTPAPPKLQQGSWWVKRPTEQVHLLWGVPGLPYDSSDRFAASLLNTYLGGGMSSTLFQEIREKNGLAYTVYSSLSPYVDTGVFSVYAATSPQKVGLCLKLIEKCLQDVMKKSLSQKELRLVQENLKGSILLSADSVESRMMSIAKNEMYLKQYLSIDEVCRRIDQVTPSELKRVAQSLFQKEQRSLFALGPAGHSKELGRYQFNFAKM
jgi:predicted Zn-dependent peptidase